MLNEDYKDMLRALSEEKVEFLLVGGYALAAHGYVRATLDMDIWVKPCPENADAVLRAIQRFGAPLHDLSQADLEREGTVFQIGVAPCRIDLMTSVTGLEFDAAASRAQPVVIEGIEVRIPALEDLIRNKRALGRIRDLADAEALEDLKNPGEEGPG